MRDLMNPERPLRLPLHVRLREHFLLEPLLPFARLILGTLRDLAPIIAVIAVFQLAVLRQPFPDIENIIIGLAFVMLGLALFVKGLRGGPLTKNQALASPCRLILRMLWLSPTT